MKISADLYSIKIIPENYPEKFFLATLVKEGDGDFKQRCLFIFKYNTDYGRVDDSGRQIQGGGESSYEDYFMSSEKEEKLNFDEIEYLEINTCL